MLAAITTGWALGGVQPSSWVRPLLNWLGLLAVARSGLMLFEEPLADTPPNHHLDGSPHSLLEWSVFSERSALLMELLMELRRDLQVPSTVSVSLHRIRAQGALKVSLCSGCKATILLRLAPLPRPADDVSGRPEERVCETFRVLLETSREPGLQPSRSQAIRLHRDRTGFSWERERLGLRRAQLSGRGRPLTLENLSSELATNEILLDALHDIESCPPGRSWTGRHELRDRAV